MKTKSNSCRSLVIPGDFPYEVMSDHAMYVTVLTDIHSLAWRPPDIMMAFRGSDGSFDSFGDTPTRRACISRPSYEVPMFIIRTCVVNIEAISRIQGTITEYGW